MVLERKLGNIFNSTCFVPSHGSVMPQPPTVKINNIDLSLQCNSLLGTFRQILLPNRGDKYSQAWHMAIKLAPNELSIKYGKLTKSNQKNLRPQ